MAKQGLQLLVGIAIAVFVTGCTYLTPYKLPIQQGNIVESDALAKLRSGMSKNQAAQALGTPLLTDVFHANRWDYVHYLNKRGRMSEQKHVVLIFEDEKLAQLIGEGVPQLQPMPAPDLPANSTRVDEPVKRDAAEPEPAKQEPNAAGRPEPNKVDAPQELPKPEGEAPEPAADEKEK